MWPMMPDNDGGTITVRISFVASLVLVGVLFALKWYRKKRIYHYEIPARDVTKGHRWCFIDIFSRPALCNICQTLMVDGAVCDSCGICADHDCIKIADKEIFCKSLSGHGVLMRHHWIHGNLPVNSCCDVCEEKCSYDEHPTKLSGYRCCWCQRTVHSICQPKMADICDMGKFREFIVPPIFVKLKLVGWKGRRHLVVKDVDRSELNDSPDALNRKWNPLIVVGNRKSGNNEGKMILQAFRGILNPTQVIDLHDLPPESAVEWCHLLSKYTCKLLVAGGDGTVGWMLNTFEKYDLKNPPHLCIIPLGTGNDLSRVLGWGESFSGDLDMNYIMAKIAKSRPISLDRWKITVKMDRPLRIPVRQKAYTMTNYISVGVDALVTLNFHRTRESKFYLFGSRLLNKFLYLSYGTKDILERECKDLNKKVELILDGKVIKLPELEALVVLNIPSWGAGVRPWGNPSDEGFSPQRIDDGLLEVFGVYSSFHIAQLQVGISEPIRLGQAKHIKLMLYKAAPMQIDGEPWEQHPAEIVISHKHQVTVLESKLSE